MHYKNFNLNVCQLLLHEKNIPINAQTFNCNKILKFKKHNGKKATAESNKLHRTLTE